MVQCLSRHAYCAPAFAAAARTARSWSIPTTNVIDVDDPFEDWAISAWRSLERKSGSGAARRPPRDCPGHCVGSGARAPGTLSLYDNLIDWLDSGSRRI